MSTTPTPTLEVTPERAAALKQISDYYAKKGTPVTSEPETIELGAPEVKESVKQDIAHYGVIPTVVAPAAQAIAESTPGRAAAKALVGESRPTSQQEQDEQEYLKALKG